MQDYRPESAIELLGTISVGIAFLFLFFSALRSNRSHWTKLSAILLVFATALFSNHWTTFFGAMFIIATAVTELEFLQNLAAIIRGSEHFFKHKRELLTQEETEERVLKEQTATGAEVAVEESVSVGGVHRAVLVEQLAIARLEKDLNESVERQVRLQKDRRSIVVDGIVAGRGRKRDRVVEVKLLRPGAVPNLIRQIPDFLRSVLVYREITDREAYLVLVLVIPNRDEAAKAATDKLRSRLQETEEDWSLYVYSFEDIGYVEDQESKTARTSVEQRVLDSDPHGDWTRTPKDWGTITTFNTDVQLRFEIRWGGSGVHREAFHAAWANQFDDPEATSYYCDLYYGASLIDRFILVSVDGGRAMLPLPRRDGQVQRLNYKVAAIHDELGSLDEYLARAGMSVLNED